MDNSYFMFVYEKVLMFGCVFSYIIHDMTDMVFFLYLFRSLLVANVTLVITWWIFILVEKSLKEKEKDKDEGK